ncbi:hypothetical protein DFS34DRAFT_606866 [Phlyctochytrium arcticum]|nr:hypothetical protein DFS34DRAFT_606866 [Phlyctochytrium arcticum]
MASDVRDILQLPTDSPRATSSIRSAAKAEKTKEKRNEGLNRELLSLTGGAPPMVLAKKKYKARPKFTERLTVSPWVWRKFKNPARKDDLELYHWVKASDDEGYYFAQFNKTVDIIQYTDEEYLAFEAEGDTGWTRPETDYLFAMCKTFDLRWFVISDRYEWEGASRTVDDLRERYYRLTRSVLAARNKGEKKEDLSAYNFNKAKELERKKNLEILYSRTPEQIKEEEYLFIELRKREAREERLQRERDAVWQLLRDNESRMVSQHNLTPTDKNIDKLKKQRKSLGPGKRAVSEDVVAAPEPSPMSARKRSKIKDEVPPESEDDSPFKIKYPPGVFARSSKIPLLRAAYIPRVQQFLQELNVSVKPNMPTAQVCAKFNELQTNIQTLLDVKKLYDKIDLDLSKMRVKARVLGAAPATGSPGPSSATPKKNSVSAGSQKDVKRTR